MVRVTPWLYNARAVMSHSTCQRQQQVSNADSIPVGTAVPGELPQDIDVDNTESKHFNYNFDKSVLLSFARWRHYVTKSMEIGNRSCVHVLMCQSFTDWLNLGLAF